MDSTQRNAWLFGRFKVGTGAVIGATVCILSASQLTLPKTGVDSFLHARELTQRVKLVDMLPVPSLINGIVSSLKITITDPTDSS